MKTLKIFVVLVFFTSGLFAESDSSSLIKGFTKWQADRIERIVIDEAIDKIFENNSIKSFFPYTERSAIRIYDGVSNERLIPILQYYIKKDMNITKQVIEKCLPKRTTLALVNSLVNIENSTSNKEDVVKLMEEINKVVKNEDANNSIEKFYDSEHCADVKDKNSSEIEQVVFERIKDNIEHMLKKKSDDINNTLNILGKLTNIKENEVSNYNRFESDGNITAFISSINIEEFRLYENKLRVHLRNRIIDKKIKDIKENEIDEILKILVEFENVSDIEDNKKYIEIKKELEAKKNISESIKNLGKILKNAKIDNKAEIKKILSKLEDNSINDIIEVIVYYDILDNLYEKFKILNEVFKNKDESYVVSSHKALSIIEELYISDTKGELNFKKLKNITLFISELVDVISNKDDLEDKNDKAEAVAAVLERYLDDDDAFIRKRNDNTIFYIDEDKKTNEKVAEFLTIDDTLFISSYYGLSYTSDSIDIDKDEKSRFRAFGPVGFEIKVFTDKRGIYSLNYSPIDIGNYITKELDGDDYDPKLRDIIEKNAFISYSFKKLPFSILAGRNLDQKYNFISFSFDLPIFTLRNPF